jgi:hypothetical protein
MQIDATQDLCTANAAQVIALIAHQLFKRIIDEVDSACLIDAEDSISALFEHTEQGVHIDYLHMPCRARIQSLAPHRFTTVGDS